VVGGVGGVGVHGVGVGLGTGACYAQSLLHVARWISEFPLTQQERHWRTYTADETGSYEY
jgi:hypothetical protein